jgi:hypothetical protein
MLPDTHQEKQTTGFLQHTPPNIKNNINKQQQTTENSNKQHKTTTKNEKT